MKLERVFRYGIQKYADVIFKRSSGLGPGFIYVVVKLFLPKACSLYWDYCEDHKPLTAS